MLSICIIGSQARRTADTFSDQDVLILGQPSSVLDEAMERWRSGGWNVSAFDRPAFCRLAEVRSLFVQHVKQEGCIVRDDDAFLSATLREYVPKSSYLAERNDALRQIAALPEQNGHYWHDLCLADIIYVLFRNASILHLASTGYYLFGYELLLKKIVSEFDLKLREIDALTALRGFKYGYRQRLLNISISNEIDTARHVILKIMSKMGNLEESGIVAGVTTDEYFNRRLRELDLAWRFTPPELDNLGPEHDLFPIWKRLIAAGGYPKDRSFKLN